MKKLFLVAIGIIALSSFTTKESEKEVVKAQYWTAKCADGSVGGYFYCDCTQTQANSIATTMCN